MSKDHPATDEQLAQPSGTSLNGVTKVNYGGGHFGMVYDDPSDDRSHD